MCEKKCSAMMIVVMVLNRDSDGKTVYVMMMMMWNIMWRSGTDIVCACGVK